MRPFMEWSQHQARALDAVAEWHRSSEEQVFRLFGYAGTGKTTLARHFAEQIDGTVLFGAFTGKAALVLRKAGCPNATTIHKLIYRPRDRSRRALSELMEHLQELQQQLAAEEHEHPDGHPEVVRLRQEIAAEEELLKRPSFVIDPESLVPDADLVVIDECSMVDEQMGEDLLAFGTKVLVLGDPAQLPPVFGTGFFTTHKPHVLLTEIHRQARDNPIIELASQVRNGEDIELGEYGESLVIDWADVEPQMALDVDQIIVGRNSLRRGTNARMRELLGRTGTPFPLKGDKVVCLRNDHEVGLLNGAIWRVVDDHRELDEHIGLELRDPEGEQALVVEAHRGHFLGEKIPHWSRKDAQEFDYGYALTCHKAQGSQWRNILVFDESRCFRESRMNWLYTAITRASERIILVR